MSKRDSFGTWDSRDGFYSLDAFISKTGAWASFGDEDSDDEE